MRNGCHTREREVVWVTLAQFWVDTEYDSAELDRLAARIAACGFSTAELERIAFEEVCGAFAADTLFIPFGGWMAMPFHDYPEPEARTKVGRFVRRPRLLSWINPLWWIGYRAARRHLAPEWRELRTRIDGMTSDPGGSQGRTRQ